MRFQSNSLPAHYLLACLVALSPLLRADAPATFDCKAVRVNGDGTFVVDGLSFGISLFEKSWAGVHQDALVTAGGFPTMAAASWQTQGTLSSSESGKSVVLKERVERLGDASFRASWVAEGPSGGPLTVPNLLCVQTLLPAKWFAGKSISVDADPVALPVTAGQNSIFDKWGASTVVIPTEKGDVTLTGDLKIHIQDDRTYQKDYFLFWLVIAKADGSTNANNLDVTFSTSSPASAPALIAK